MQDQPTNDPPPPPPQKAAVLAATLLPVMGVLVFGAFLFALGWAGFKLTHRIHLPPLSQLSPPAIPDTPPPTPPTIITAAPPAPAPIPKIAPVPTPPPMPAPAPVPVPTATVQVAEDAPLLNDLTPSIVPTGGELTLHGENLARVRSVRLLDTTDGTLSSPADVVFKSADTVRVTIPKVTSPDHSFYIVAFTPFSVAVLAEDHVGATPWGTDGHLHNTAVAVMHDDQISVLDHMIVFAQTGASVALGNNCTAFFMSDAALTSCGRNCHVYYDTSINLPDDFPPNVALRKQHVQVSFNGDAFRVKPASEQN